MDIKAQLDELKTSLEAKLEAKYSKEIADLKKQVEEALAKAVKPEDADAMKSDIAKWQAEMEKFSKDLETIDARVKSTVKAAAPVQKSFNEGLGEAIKENHDKIRSLKKGQAFQLELKEVTDMTFSTAFSTADTSVTQVRPGIIELPKRKLHLAQLLPGGTMGTSNFDYVKEVTGEEGPEAVAEGSEKNQFELALQEVSSPAQYIAGYIRISRKMLDDVQGMTTFLQSRLLELYLREEDDQILNGDGNSPNLSGITDTGNFTAFGGSATVDVEQLVESISQLEGYDREANGILLHPTDYWRIALTKGATSGDYTMPAGIVVVGEDGVLRIGGVPVYRSTAMTVDKFLVGDWLMGANLLTREAPRVEFFVEDGINVRENKVTVRVEGRKALPIYGSDYFIYGDFGNAS